MVFQVMLSQISGHKILISVFKTAIYKNKAIIWSGCVLEDPGALTQ